MDVVIHVRIVLPGADKPPGLLFEYLFRFAEFETFGVPYPHKIVFVAAKKELPMITLKESLAEAMQIMLDTVSRREPEGVKTGYPELDNLTRGMRKGSLSVLVSGPSLGKTAFALNIVGNLMGRKPEIPVLYCSGLSHTKLSFRLAHHPFRRGMRV